MLSIEMCFVDADELAVRVIEASNKICNSNEFNRLVSLAKDYRNARQEADEQRGFRSHYRDLRTIAHELFIRRIFAESFHRFMRDLSALDASGSIAVKIASGTVVMPTDVIPAGSCGTVINAKATELFQPTLLGFRQILLHNPASS